MARRRGEENEPHHVRAGIQRDVERLACGQAANFDDQGHMGHAFWQPRRAQKGPLALEAAFYNVAPCLSRPAAHPPCDGADRRCGSGRKVIVAPARRSASCARACRAAASCWRAARRQWRCRNQVAEPPATTPVIAAAMMTTNSGSLTATDGSVELNGSNDTVTRWRLATAKMMKIRPSGISTSAVKNFRMTISLVLGDCRARRAPTRSRSYDRNTRDRNVLGTGVGRPAFAVQAFAHFLAGLEKRHALLVDRHMRAGARIAAGA